MLLVMILGFHDVILNLCLHETAGKRSTTQGIILQMEAAMKSLHTRHEV